MCTKPGHWNLCPHPATGPTPQALTVITNLKKICNHPRLYQPDEDTRQRLNLQGDPGMDADASMDPQQSGGWARAWQGRIVTRGDLPASCGLTLLTRFAPRAVLLPLHYAGLPGLL
jgi:hypothetical protein